MVDEEIAREAIALLSTAIGVLMEGQLQTALVMRREAAVAADGLVRFRVLKSVGEDVQVLAEAIGVLARRAGAV